MKYLFLSAALLLSCSSFAQNAQIHCGTKYSSGWETPEFNTARLPENFAAKSTATYSIPVVFHVVHNAGPENMTTVAINNALNGLNKRFANQLPYNDPDGVNTDISFCLAAQDSDGNVTTGIIYHPDEATDFHTYKADNGLPSGYPVDSLIKSLYHWPTDKYLNVYIVKDMGMMTSAGSFPDMHGNFMDGLMIVYNTIMGEGLAHEGGHYFGLYHTFQASCANSDCLNDNDKVCDTPPDILADYDPQTCTINTCATDEDDVSTNNPFRSTTLGGLGDQNDDTKNYMDLNACNTKKYTQGQKERMHATIITERQSLLTSPGCQPVSVNAVQRRSIAVYPNPVSDAIYIDGANNSLATVSNTLGQQVLSDNISSNAYAVNIASLPAGVYMLVIANKDGNEKVMRIVKQ